MTGIGGFDGPPDSGRSGGRTLPVTAGLHVALHRRVLLTNKQADVNVMFP